MDLVRQLHHPLTAEPGVTAWTRERHARERDCGHGHEDKRRRQIEEQEHEIDAERWEERENDRGRSDPAIETLDPGSAGTKPPCGREDDRGRDPHVDA